MAENNEILDGDNKNDSPGIGWQILAFLIPLAGIIMYFNNKSQFPNKANRYILLAGISFAIGFITRLI